MIMVNLTERVKINRREVMRGMITLNQANKALEASQQKAKELGISVSIVIVDEHGALIAANRMDAALPISPQIAHAKAFTAASLGVPSEGLAEYVKEGKPYFGINTLFGGKLTPMAGGLPVMKANKIVGGVGVGGSADVAQDAECAKAAVETMQL